MGTVFINYNRVIHEINWSVNNICKIEGDTKLAKIS